MVLQVHHRGRARLHVESDGARDDVHRLLRERDVLRLLRALQLVAHRLDRLLLRTVQLRQGVNSCDAGLLLKALRILTLIVVTADFVAVA